jgi:hypothetical protein
MSGHPLSHEAVRQLHFALRNKKGLRTAVRLPWKKKCSCSRGIQKRLPRKTEEKMQRTSKIDRRSGEDRRKVHDLDYLVKGGVERRTAPERRCHHSERRSDWVMIDRWYSIALGPIAGTPHLVLDEIPGEAGTRADQIPRKALRNILPFRRSFPVP